MLDRLCILADKGCCVAVVKAKDGVVTTLSGVLDQISTWTGINFIMAGSPGDRIGTATGMNRVVANTTVENIWPGPAGDQVVALSAIDRLGAGATSGSCRCRSRR